MNPFDDDDTISEENMPPYQDMVSLLRQATPTASATAEEQFQILARVRARLYQTNDVSPEGEFPVPENPDVVFQPSPLRRKVPYRFNRVRRTLNMIAAVLIIGVIVGASLLLFASHQASNLGDSIPTGAAIGPMKAPVTVRSQAGGLEASLQVTAGPYFLSELLAVTVTLTNHSNERFSFFGPVSFAASCLGGLLHLAITGGSEPHYDFPLDKFSVSCPLNTTITVLDVGKTLTMHGYFLLTKSGRIALTSDAIFLVSTHGRPVTNGVSIINGMIEGPGPLDGHWPIMHIVVAAKVPADRIVSIRQQSSQITIDAPTSIQSQLVYYDVVACTERGNTASSVSTHWKQVLTPILQEPRCSGATRWTYAVSAPGYAVVSGVLTA